jgi:hypothetical protein
MFGLVNLLIYSFQVMFTTTLNPATDLFVYVLL